MAEAVALLETMWDWRRQTSMANPNYLAEAPRCFRINPENFSGKRLYRLLGHKDLLVTNACPQLGRGATDHGQPEVDWTQENLRQLYPFSLLLVCGKVAQRTYDRCHRVGEYRTIYMPHPAARTWTDRDLSFAARLIQLGDQDLELTFRGGRLRASILVPF